MQNVKRTELHEQINFTAVDEQVFKTALISVSFFTPLNAKTAAANAVVPFLLCRGKDFTALRRQLDELYGAVLDAEVSKIGANQVLTLTIQTARSRFAQGEDTVTDAARLLAELIINPALDGRSFRPADVEAEKQNVTGLILARKNEKREFAIDRAAEFVFEGTPYGVGRYGDEKSVAKLDGKKLFKAWRSILRRSVIEIICIGDGDSAGAEQVFASEFGKIRRSPKPAPKPKKPKLCKQNGEVIERMDVAQAKLILAYRTQTMLPDDCAALEVMNCIYGTSTTSKLFMNVREKLSLCYYCVSRCDRHLGMLMADSGVLEANVEAAKAEIAAQLSAIAEGDFTDDEAEQAKLFLSNLRRSACGSITSLCAYWLAETAAGTLRTPDEAEAQFKAVTREQIIAAAAGCRLDYVYLLAPAGEEKK